MVLPVFISTARNPISGFSLRTPTRKQHRGTIPSVVIKASMGSEDSSQKPTKLVTFLGKGGSGKTTAAVFAAQHYAMAGLCTCLVIHTQDPTAEYLLNCKIGTAPTLCGDNLSAVRLETIQMILEPLNRLKQADARLNMTQGFLNGVVGEELGVLPGMDSIVSAFSLEKLLSFLGSEANKNHQKDRFDIVVYDGISTEETLRVLGAASKARLYLKYLRSITEKTDLGRLASPSLLRLVDEAMSITSGKSYFSGNTSAEIWNTIEHNLERGSSAFLEPHRLGCFLVVDGNNLFSVKSALRYWGCTIQAGAQISGALAVSSPHMSVESKERIMKDFSPLPFAFIPHLSVDSHLHWNEIMQHSVSGGARGLLSLPATQSSSVPSPVCFDTVKKTVTLLIPGFDKSEIKLYQYRGGSELLVEAGDQRRVIYLPSEIQGKVGGAKFIDRSLVITMR